MADIPNAGMGAATPHGGNASPSGNILTKRIGPLPVVGWVIVAIGAYLVYRYIQNRNASAATTTPLATNNALPGTDQTSNPTTTTTGAQGGDEAWVVKAEADLIRLGYDPNTVRMVLRRYLSGEQLDKQEEAMIDAAINLDGQPPGGGGNLGTLAPPKPKPPKKRPHRPTPGVGSGHNPHGHGFGGINQLPGLPGSPPGHSHRH